IISDINGSAPARIRDARNVHSVPNSTQTGILRQDFQAWVLVCVGYIRAAKKLIHLEGQAKLTVEVDEYLNQLAWQSFEEFEKLPPAKSKTEAKRMIGGFLYPKLTQYLVEKNLLSTHLRLEEQREIEIEKNLELARDLCNMDGKQAPLSIITLERHQTAMYAEERYNGRKDLDFIRFDVPFGGITQDQAAELSDYKNKP